MKIRYAQIESIKQHLTPCPGPAVVVGMIEVTALGITKDNKIVRFRARANDSQTNPPLHEFLDAFSKLLEGTEQVEILDKRNEDGRLESK